MNEPGLRSVVQAAVVMSAAMGCGFSKNDRSSPPPDEWVLDPPLSVAAEIVAADAGDDPGPRLYQHYCAVCHGPQGKGDGQYFSNSLDPPPADLTDPRIQGPPAEDRVAKVIRDGSGGVGKSALCPPWVRVFSDQQIADLTRHVRRLASPPD